MTPAANSKPPCGVESKPATIAWPTAKPQPAVKPQPAAKPLHGAKSKSTTKSKLAAKSYPIVTLKSDLTCPSKSGVFYNFCFMKFSQICTVWVVVSLRPCFLGHLTPGSGVLSLNMGIDLPWWVLISLPSFSPDSQGTMPADASLALGPPARHLGEVWDLI